MHKHTSKIIPDSDAKQKMESDIGCKFQCDHSSQVSAGEIAGLGKALVMVCEDSSLDLHKLRKTRHSSMHVCNPRAPNARSSGDRRILRSPRASSLLYAIQTRDMISNKEEDKLTPEVVL